MMLLVQNRKTKFAARDMAEEFRITRKQAREALMARDAQSFQMYAAQMSSMLLMEFHDRLGNVGRVITYLTDDEQRNPYQLTQSESIEVSQWIFTALQHKMPKGMN